MGPGITYVLCPYTHKNSRVRQWRVDTAAMYCAALRAEGVHPYCAIVECHPVEAFMDGDKGAFEHWEEYNQLQMTSATDAVILPLPGWKTSNGIEGECKFWYEDLQRGSIIRIDSMWLERIALNV